MGRILAIDYGRKRCGIAATDTLGISANPLPWVRTCDITDWLAEFCKKENVERILIGEPKDLKGNASESMQYIKPFVKRISNLLPDIPIEMVDERFTSVIAHREMLAGGFKKKDRQRKGFADEMAATIILTTWLESRAR